MEKRDKILDFLRVGSIFLVIVIHLANCYYRQMTYISDLDYSIAALFNTFARISVPIFFMISGVLLIPRRHHQSDYIKRVKKMTIVLVLWTIIYLIWEYLFFGNKIDNIFSLLFAPQRAHLWFMYAIVALYIALPFISKMAKNLTRNEENLFLGLWIFFSGFCFILENMLNIEAKYEIPIISGTYYLGYFLAGHIIYKRIKQVDNPDSLKKYNLLLLGTFIITNLIIFIVTLVMSNITGTYYKGAQTYTNLFMVLSSLSIFTYLLINLKKDNKFIKNTSTLAPYVFGIYLIHGIFLDILNKLVNLSNIPSIIGIICFSCLLFFISWIFIYFLKKIPVLNKYIC